MKQLQRLLSKQIVLGITGGIAAYKSADLARRFCEAGAKVRVVMTQNAKQFMTPLTLQAVSGNPVHDDLFDLKAEAAMGHIELGRWADVVLIAPASADCMAKLSHGEASDLLTTLCLVTRAPIALAPAMNQSIWKHIATQNNVQALQAKGIHIFGPGEGSQACGETGPGRMLEPVDLVEKTTSLFENCRLSGKRVLITAGPTHEPIDPIRFMTNASSGKMGYALAQAAIEAGADVTLISGPVALAPPARAKTIRVITAQEMLESVLSCVPDCDLFIGVAAVSDYRCKKIAPQKLKKTSPTLTLELEHNPDIISTVAARAKKPFIVGFSAETENLSNNARTKLLNKNMDMIIANEAGSEMAFGKDENTVTVFWGQEQREFPRMTKYQLARELIVLITELLCNQKIL